MREVFMKMNQEKTKRFHMPTGESPQPKKAFSKDQQPPVAKRGLAFSASRDENSARNTDAIEKEKKTETNPPDTRNHDRQEMVHLEDNANDSVSPICRPGPVINEHFGQSQGPPLVC